MPTTAAFRTGGLQEVALHPQFATNQLVYLTYNKAGAVGQAPNQRQGAVTLVRGKFDGKALTGVEELMVGDWNNGASGSRIAFGPNGMLYMTTGAPFNDQAQKLDTVYGKVLRLRDDGKVPPDNPFVGPRRRAARGVLVRPPRLAGPDGARRPPAPCSTRSTGPTAATR